MNRGSTAKINKCV